MSRCNTTGISPVSGSRARPPPIAVNIPTRRAPTGGNQPITRSRRMPRPARPRPDKPDEDRDADQIADEQAGNRSVDHRLVDLLALRADRGAGLRRLGHRELLPAERHDEGAHDRALGDLLLADVMEHLRTG